MGQNTKPSKLSIFDRMRTGARNWLNSISNFIRSNNLTSNNAPHQQAQSTNQSGSPTGDYVNHGANQTQILYGLGGSSLLDRPSLLAAAIIELPFRNTSTGNCKNPFEKSYSDDNDHNTPGAFIL